MSRQGKEYRGFLSGNALKWIAMVTMCIDHIGLLLFPNDIIFRIIGRLAFPIYCFLLVEGAVHTSSPKRYLGRLFLFALISEIPFNLAAGGTLRYPEAQNVLFTLLLGLLAIFLLKEPPVWQSFILGKTQDNSAKAEQSRKCKTGEKQMYIIGIRWLLGLALVLLAEFARTDYGGGGVLIILIFYWFRAQVLQRSFFVVAVLVFLYGGIENYAILSLVPILCYNGKRSVLSAGRGKDNAEAKRRSKYSQDALKYFFYLFYPAHLLILYALATYAF